MADAHHAGPVHALAVHPSCGTTGAGPPLGGGGGGVLVASGGDDCRVHVAALGSGGGHSFSSGAVAAAVRTRHRVTSLAWACAAPADGGDWQHAPASGNGAQLLVGQEDGALAAYDLRALRLEPPAAAAAAGGDARRVHVPVFRLPGHRAGVRSLAVGWACGSGGRGAPTLLCASGGDDGVVRLASLQPEAPWLGLQRVAAHQDCVRALAWASPSGGAGPGALLSGGWDGAVLEHCVR